MIFHFKQNIRAGIFWIGSLKTIGQVFLWINTIIIARFLDPAAYGLAGMAILVTSFILLVGSFGLGSSIIQKKDLQNIHLYSLFWITFVIGLLFAGAIYFASPIAARFFNNPKVAPLLQLSAGALFFSIISEIPYSLLIKNLQYKFAGLVDLVSNLIANVSILIFAIKGFGAHSLIFGSLIMGFLKLSLSCLLSHWLPRLQFQRHGLKGFLKFGGAIVTSRILWYLYDNADYVILAKKLGQAPFGLYSFAFNLASTPTNKLQPILAPVLYSSFSMMQDDHPQIRDKYLKIIRFAFAAYAMIYCGMFWVSREFVTIFLGSKWVQIILVLQILLAVQPFRAISSFSSSLMDTLGRPAVIAVNAFILLIIMVPSFLLGSRWGMVGVSIMWCVAYPVAFFITMSRNMRVAQIPMKNYLMQLLPGLRLVVVASVVLYLFSVLISHVLSADGSHYQLISLFGKIVLGSISYLLTLLYVDRELIKMATDFVKHEP